MRMASGVATTRIRAGSADGFANPVAGASGDKDQGPGRARVFLSVQRERDRPVKDIDRLIERPMQV